MLKRKRDDDFAEHEEADQFVFVGDDFDDKVTDEHHNIHETLSTYHLDHDIHHSHLLNDHGDDTTSAGAIDPWTNEEDAKLNEAIELYGWGNPAAIDWEKVCEHVETNKTADQCAKRWNYALKYHRSEFRSLPWTKEEDELLELAVKQYEGQGLRGGVDWERVRMYVSEARSANQCRARWNGILKHRTPQVNNAPWTDEEDELLLQAVGLSNNPTRRGSIDWITVSQFMGGHRSSQQCSHRWNRVLKTRGLSANSLPWTDEEDNSLREAANEFAGQGLRGGVDWQRVFNKMGGARSPQQYCHRWNRVVKLKGTLSKNTPWTEEEDERLIEAVNSYEGRGVRGAVDWGSVSEYMGGDRTSQQCCHRWTGILKHRGTMKNTPWTKEEDTLLTEAVTLFQDKGLRGGVSWVHVSEYLNKQRSCQQCAHRWNRVLKHRISHGLNTSNWTQEEDENLRNAAKRYEGKGLRGGVDWGKVAEEVGGARTSQQCCTRWNRVLKNNSQFRPQVWTDADDQKLIEAINIFRGVGRGGTIDWGQVSEYVGSGRTREQNCGRWNGVLKHRLESISKDQTHNTNENTREIEVIGEGIERDDQISEYDHETNLFDM